MSFRNAYRAASLTEIRDQLEHALAQLKALPYSREKTAAIWDLAEVSGRLKVLIAGLQEEAA